VACESAISDTFSPNRLARNESGKPLRANVTAIGLKKPYRCLIELPCGACPEAGRRVLTAAGRRKWSAR
jgi:ferredoxin